MEKKDRTVDIPNPEDGARGWVEPHPGRNRFLLPADAGDGRLAPPRLTDLRIGQLNGKSQVLQQHHVTPASTAQERRPWGLQERGDLSTQVGGELGGRRYSRGAHSIASDAVSCASRGQDQG